MEGKESYKSGNVKIWCKEHVGQSIVKKAITEKRDSEI